MAAITTAITAVAAIAGLGLAAYGTHQQVEGAKKARKATKKAEAIRQQEAELEAIRTRRAMIRNSILANAQSTTRAVSQGAQFGSVLPGALFANIGQLGRNIQSLNQNQELGSQMFDANAQLANAQTQSSTGAGLTNLGMGIVSNIDVIGRVGSRLEANRSQPAPQGY